MKTHSLNRSILFKALSMAILTSALSACGGASSFKPNTPDPITANQTISGASTIDNVISANVTITDTGSLTGRGLVEGNLTNNGIIHVTKGPDPEAIIYRVLAVGGDFRQGNGGELMMDVDTLLNVNGNAYLDGTLTIVTPDTYVTSGTVVNYIQATNISGTFDLVRSSSVFFNAAATYNATTTGVTLTSVAPLAALKGASNVDQMTIDGAARLEQTFGAIDDRLNSGQAVDANFLASAGKIQSSQSAQIAAISIDSLSGQAYASANGLTLNHAEFAQRLINQRQTQAVADGEYGLFATASAERGNITPLNGFDANYNATTLVFGVTAPITDQWSVGGAVSVTNSQSDLDRLGGRIDGQQTGFGAQIRYSGERFYASGHAGTGYIRNDVDRIIDLGGPQFSASAETDTTVKNAGIEVGFPIGRFTPFVGVTYDSFKTDAFRETGSTGFELNAQEASGNRTAGNIGVRSDYDWVWGEGFVCLDGYAMYRRNFSTPETGFFAEYTGLPGSVFFVDGNRFDDSAVWLGLGLEAARNKNTNFFVRFDGRMGGDSHLTAVTAGFRHDFK